MLNQILTINCVKKLVLRIKIFEMYILHEIDAKYCYHIKRSVLLHYEKLSSDLKLPMHVY